MRCSSSDYQYGWCWSSAAALSVPVFHDPFRSWMMVSFEAGLLDGAFVKMESLVVPLTRLDSV